MSEQPDNSTPRRRGRGRPIAEALAARLDRALLKILKVGVEARDEVGNVVILPPSAAHLAVIRARVRDLERAAKRGTRSGDAYSLIEEARRRGMRIGASPEAG